MNKKRLQGRFIERVMAHRYRLDEYSREELVKIYMALNEAEKSILRRWDVSTDWSRTRARRLLKEARAIMGAVKPRVGESLADLLGEVSASSSQAYSDMLSLGGRAGAVRVALLSAEQMRSFWRETPVGGRLLQDWVGRVLDGPTVDAVQRQVFAGMFEGEGFAEMARRLRDGFVTGRREAETLVHTYVQTANVHAMEEVYKKNRDVVAGVRWLTAFDKRTCLRCAALSGKLYPLDEHPDCPCHPRCRCVLIPETDIGKLKVRPKIAEDWAKDLKKKPPGLETVLTPDGIPKTDFRRWIMAQPEKDQLAFFKPVRYGLLKDGKIGWDDLVEEDGKTVRVRLLPELLGDRVVAHRALDKANPNAAKTLGQIRKERADLEKDRHQAIADKLDERAMKKAVGDAAKAAELLARGETERAEALGGRALEKIIRGTGLLGEKYRFDGVEFVTIKENSMMEAEMRSGKIRVSAKSFQKSVINELGELETISLRPMEGLLNALKKIHEGAPLTFADEACLQTFHHEIQHTRQKVAKGRRTLNGVEFMMELVNDWTSRRNYHAFLQKLGRESILSKETKKYGLAYRRRVRNFDLLLERLGIGDDRELLDAMTRINETKEVGKFHEEVAELLIAKKSKDAKPLRQAVTVWDILEKLDYAPKNFKEWLK